MVTSFYIMKLNEARVNMEEYYSDLHNTPLHVFSKHLKRKTKCRVCLQDGDMPMNSVTNHNEMKEALNIFADIEFHNSDEDQTYILCYVCYKFLKNAILFRKVAQRTNETLKQSSLPKTIKQSSIQQTLRDSPDNFQNCEYSRTPNDDKPDHSIEVECEEDFEEECTEIQCPICQKLLRKSYYKKHMDLHNPDTPAQRVCEICGKALKSKKSYYSHKKRHETRYIYKCELCPYAGRHSQGLWMHMRVHTGELKYLCTECPARYTSGGSLSYHIKLKHTEPQYKCDSCDKAYHNNLNLQRHIEAAHLKIKQHQCDICDSGFSYRKAMLNHQRLVHKRASLRSHLGIKNHECNVCGKRFGYRLKEMLEHQRKIHKMAGLRP
ncbi:zinc finger protein 667-like [Maniola jurtina]|uniref:zinc finger protein 667-like n=1 Tax=Maniola jurtina TaxID=191418 RepID=UPI001E6866E1|nr:zinc finger protein 667-like [Maniola jurtina]